MLKLKPDIFFLIVLVFHFAPGVKGADKYTKTNTDTVNFVCNELLSRPTNNSININLCADKDIEAYAEYGISKAVYTLSTPIQQFQSFVPTNISIENLKAGTRYYYRINYRLKGALEFLPREEHSFTTQRAKGEQFSFAIEADPHLDENTNADLLTRTFMNILEGNNDFLLDLGDNFMSEKEPVINEEIIIQRHLLLRKFYDTTCHSVPLFLVLGNHEGELGFLLDGTENCLPVWATNIRKQYYPNPIPDGFYSGNKKEENFVGLRENYYAWEWGNALFVVLDPYWYTTIRQGDNWRFTLGKDQYEWFKNTLETSDARFKFVFSHQILGGKDNQGRGGGDYAQYYEMGGLNSDSLWGFNEHRPGWDIPVHQLMVKNHVNIFFHGHDHFYARQEKDGVIYQLVPQPGYSGDKSTEKAAEFGYFTGIILPSSGYLKVTVNDTTATVDYIKSYLPAMETDQKKNGMIEYSYSIYANGNVSLADNKYELPSGYKLFQNYPNPFNPETEIKYTLPSAGNVQLKIFDLLGRELVTLINEYQQPGTYSISFNSQKLMLGSGIYYYKIAAGNYSKTMKMICLK